MSLIEHYRTVYEYEKDCNRKMLAMLESVPEAGRSEVGFQQAVTLADHLAAGRENWLGYLEGHAGLQTAWWNEQCDLAALPLRFAVLERRWTDYLAGLSDEQLAQDFEFTEAAETFRVPIGVQIEQLASHTAYHRGQIALIVDLLGGETVDTDYVDWCWRKQYQAEDQV